MNLCLSFENWYSQLSNGGVYSIFIIEAVENITTGTNIFLHSTFLQMEEDRRVWKEAECKEREWLWGKESDRMKERAEAALWSLLGLTTPHCRHFNNCPLCYNNTGLPCLGQFQFLHQCPSCARQAKGPMRLNRRQSQIALSVASLAVNEAIFLAPLRGN